jgi:hypothetical protein
MMLTPQHTARARKGVVACVLRSDDGRIHLILDDVQADSDIGRKTGNQKVRLLKTIMMKVFFLTQL